MSTSSNLPPNTTLEPFTANRLVTTTTTPYATVLSRFRALVPPFPKSLLDGTHRTRASYEATVNAAVGPHGFILFNEYNHGVWIKLFPEEKETEGSTTSTSVTNNRLNALGQNLAPTNGNLDLSLGPNGGLALHRFIFGNPLIAITMIREDVEAGLHVPIELLLVETAPTEENGGTKTKLVAQLPSGLIAGHEKGRRNEGLKEAVAVLDGKFLGLVKELTT